MLQENLIVIGLEGGVYQGASLINWKGGTPVIEVIDWDDVHNNEVEPLDVELTDTLDGKQTGNTITNIY